MNNSNNRRHRDFLVVASRCFTATATAAAAAVYQQRRCFSFCSYDIHATLVFIAVRVVLGSFYVSGITA